MPKFYIINIQIEILISLTIYEIRCLTKGCYLGYAAVLFLLPESPFTRHSKERLRERDQIGNIFQKISGVLALDIVEASSFSFTE